MAILQVFTFASYAELMGSPIEISLDLPTTLQTVVAALRAAPGGDVLPPQPLIAINFEMARGDVTVRVGDEVALLPPLAGG